MHVLQRLINGGKQLADDAFSKALYQ